MNYRVFRNCLLVIGGTIAVNQSAQAQSGRSSVARAASDTVAPIRIQTETSPRTESKSDVRDEQHKREELTKRLQERMKVLQEKEREKQIREKAKEMNRVKPGNQQGGRDKSEVLQNRGN